MNHNPKAYLFDIKQACDAIAEFTHGLSYSEYSGNAMVKAAVERKFLTIGEALIRLKIKERKSRNLEGDYRS